MFWRSKAYSLKFLTTFWKLPAKFRGIFYCACIRNSGKKRGRPVFIICMFEDWGLPIDESSFGRNYLLDHVNTRMDWKRKEGIYCTTFSLVVARRLSEFLGGRLELSRRGGNVNVMKLELPLKKSWKDKITQLELKPELFPNDVSLKGYKILVIESQNEESDMMGYGFVSVEHRWMLLILQKKGWNYGRVMWQSHLMLLWWMDIH